MDRPAVQAERVVADIPKDISELGAAGCVESYRQGKTLPDAVLSYCLDRIDRYNDDFRAISDLDREGAERAALESKKRWNAGASLSPLDGVPIAVKANIAVKGLPWTAGIGAYARRIADEDAACVTGLRAAGAIVLGTTNMHEGALGSTTDNPWFGRTQNPFRYGHTAGGSSGGSAAAVGAGFCAAALGTDTIGSVRIPASYCGVFGFKPGRLAISNKGIMPLSWTLDAVGVLATSARYCRLVTDAAAQIRLPCSDDPPLDRLRIAALDWGKAVDVEPAVGDAFATAVERARHAGLVVRKLALENFDFARLQRHLFTIAEVEGAVIHERALREHPEGFSADFTRLLAWGAAQSATNFAGVLRKWNETVTALRRDLAAFDAVLLPATPQLAFAFDTKVPANQAAFTALASSLDMPATAFPVGISDGGLPLSAQVLAQSESLCLRLSEILSMD
jgi:aspartyl-tRNA(Asn)/glutamyl-tRNA(Gln) amidotransferase subunit A